MQSTTFILGLTFSEFVTLLGIVAGPIVAVCISLAVEERRRHRTDQMHVLRVLLATRVTPGDANYIGAINLVPVLFNERKTVMQAWRDYMEAVRYKPQPSDEAAHLQRINAKQTALIFAVMQALKLSFSEGEIQTEAYISTAFTTRDTIYIKSLEALPQIAQSAQRSADAAERMVGLISGNAQQAKGA